MGAAKRILHLAISILSLAALSCGGGGGGSSAPASLATVPATAAAGGTLEVTTGEFAGLQLVIPPGALSSDTLITLDPGRSSLEAGFAALGPAGKFSPEGLQFSPAASLTMPFDPLALPAIVDPADLVVLLQDETTGAIEELIPSLIDEVNGLVTVDLPHFSVAWVAAPLPPIDVVDHLPLNVGDEYVMEGLLSGVIGVLRVEPGPISVNFPEPDLLTLSLEIDGFRSGYYIRRSPNGDTSVVGNFGDDGVSNLEESHQFETLFAPGVALDGEVFETTSDYTGHIPIGSPDVAYTGNYEAISEVFRADGPVSVPAGDVQDPVIFLRDEFYQDSDGFSGRALAIFWLAQGVGPIALELDRQEVFLLVSGTVGGQPIVLSEER